MNLQCPFCGSERIQRHAVIRQSDTVHIQYEHRDAIGGYAAHGSGVQQSSLAQHCAPPAPPNPLPFLIASALGACFLYFSLTEEPAIYWTGVFISMAVLGLGYGLMKFWCFQARVYREDKRQWQDTWFCHGCGQSHLRS